MSRHNSKCQEVYWMLGRNVYYMIYALGKFNGDQILNRDLVMLYYARGNQYVSIQGEKDRDDTSLNNCPGTAPPSYFDFFRCSKNVFRIYKSE